MQLYLVRHAIAEDRGLPGVADEDRKLTDKGIRRMKRNVRALSALGVRIGEIWTSPLVRARQTAELLARLRGFEGDVREVDALRPGGDFNELAASLGESVNGRSLALVGHEPDLSELAAWLLSGRAESFVEMRKGGAACFEVEGAVSPGCARLAWLMPPRVLRRLDG